VLDRIKREQEFFDELVVEPSTARKVLDQFSKAYYEKGMGGRLWTPVWQNVDLKGSVVLDYGCGIGDFSLLLARRGARVYGIDISPKLIEQARASIAGSGLNGFAPEFFVGDAHQTPFEGSSFDYVFGNGALHHLDLSKALAEISRILKPGGKAMFQEPMYHHPLM
jgi:ubiquinone/menaquinone biosynthesis C-methylase UbiE